MSKYLKLFETTSQYEAYMGGGEKILPNVSLIEETNKVEYNPYIPPQPIRYTASEKLNKTWDDETATFGATIKSHTFENGVGTIEFNDYVTSIGYSAFLGCTNLTSVTIPNSVTSIDGYAFYNCSNLTSINIPDSVTSIDNSAFSDCTSLPVENNIRYADTCAVLAVDNTLSTYTIKEGTRFIGNSAFRNCTNLTSITIPNSVTYIGDSAFDSCSSLTSVTIPDSVTSIGWYAFKYCSSLTSVTVESTTPPSLGSNAFNNNASGRKIYVPAESVAAYKSASGWSTYASDIEAIPT